MLPGLAVWFLRPGRGCLRRGWMIRCSHSCMPGGHCWTDWLSLSLLWSVVTASTQHGKGFSREVVPLNKRSFKWFLAFCSLTLFYSCAFIIVDPERPVKTQWKESEDPWRYPTVLIWAFSGFSRGSIGNKTGNAVFSFMKLWNLFICTSLCPSSVYSTDSPELSAGGQTVPPRAAVC